MTTVARREAYAEGAPPAVNAAAPGPGGPGRFARWRGSWSVALRMARRDLRRSRGRSILVVIMVALPIALVSFAATSVASSDTAGPQVIPFSLGTSQAAVWEPTGSVVEQRLTAQQQNYGTTPTPAQKIPGWPAANAQGVVPGLDDSNVDSPTVKALAAVVATTVGGEARAVPTRSAWIRVGWTDGATPRGRDVGVFAADGREGLGEKVKLTSGRWPTNDNEVLVTELGVESGLPGAGSLSIRQGGSDRPVTIVGHVVAYDELAGPITGIVGLSTYGSTSFATGHTTFLLFRSAPVTWADVQRMNRFGMAVTSAEVLRNPPALSEMTPAVATAAEADDQRMTSIQAGVGTVLVLVIALLVGPAFAVSAARQRRTLALAASNGATVAQLRRSVLAQALVLGALATVLGAVLGVVAVASLAGVAMQAAASWWPGVQVPYLTLTALVLVGILSAVVAALIPAQRLGRLDIIGVMKGQNVSPRPNRVLPVIGLVAAVVGGAVLFQAIVQRSQNALIVVGGGFALVLGFLLCVPIILVGFGRMARRLPVSLRLATRELARQRTRSVPTVAASVGAVAALTTMLVAVASNSEQQQRTYTPSAMPGHGVVGLGSDPAMTRQQVALAAPGLTLTDVGSLGGYPTFQESDQPTTLVVPKAGCTAKDVAAAQSNPDPSAAETGCSGYGNLTGAAPSVATISAEEIIRRYHLSTAQAEVIRAGGALVTDPSLTAGGKVTVFELDTTSTAATPPPPTATTLPAVAAQRLDPLTGGPTAGMNMAVLIDPKTATDHGWRSSPALLELADPRGPISREVEDQVNGALAGDVSLSVERGYQSSDALLYAVLIGAFTLLLLIVTLTSTALSLAEQRVDQATMAAVGATRATRRRLTAAQSLVTSFVGTLGGVAIGLVPGIALCYPVTQVALSSTCGPNGCVSVLTPAVIVVPWLPIVGCVVGIPLLAAGLSALAVRRAPLVTRRAT